MTTYDKFSHNNHKSEKVRWLIIFISQLTKKHLICALTLPCLMIVGNWPTIMTVITLFPYHAVYHKNCGHSKDSIREKEIRCYFMSYIANRHVSERVIGFHA